MSHLRHCKPFTFCDSPRLLSPYIWQANDMSQRQDIFQIKGLVVVTCQFCVPSSFFCSRNFLLPHSTSTNYEGISNSVPVNHSTEIQQNKNLKSNLCNQNIFCCTIQSSSTKYKNNSDYLHQLKKHFLLL